MKVAPRKLNLIGLAMLVVMSTVLGYVGSVREMEGVDEALAREAFALAAAKLPLRTTFVQRMIG